MTPNIEAMQTKIIKKLIIFSTFLSSIIIRSISTISKPISIYSHNVKMLSKLTIR